MKISLLALFVFLSGTMSIVYSMQLDSLKQRAQRKLESMFLTPQEHEHIVRDRELSEHVLSSQAQFRTRLITALAPYNHEPEFLQPLLLLAQARKAQNKPVNTSLIFKFGKSHEPSMLLSPWESNNLTHVSQTLSHINQDFDSADSVIQDNIPELPLDELTVREAQLLLPYITLVRDMNLFAEELPEFGSKETQIYQRKQYEQQILQRLQQESLEDLCVLLQAASYLDIRSNATNYTLAQAAVKALAQKLLEPANLTQLWAQPIIPQTLKVLLSAQAQQDLTREVLTISGAAAYLNICNCQQSPDAVQVSPVLDTSLPKQNNYGYSLISPNGQYRVYKTDKTSITIADVKGGEDIYHFPIESSAHRPQFSWSPDSKYVTHASYDTGLKVWDVATGDCMELPEIINAQFWWSPAGTYLAVKTPTGLSLFSTNNWQCLWNLDDYNSCCAVQWSPDGKYMALGRCDGDISIVDTYTGILLKNIGEYYQNYLLTWSSNGQYITQIQRTSYSTNIFIWNVFTGELIRIFKSRVDPTPSIIENPQEDMFAYIDNEGIVLWEPQSDNFRILREPEGKPMRLIGSFDGSYLICGYDNGILHVWETKTWKHVALPQKHKFRIGSLEWAADNCLISDDGSTKYVYNLTNTAFNQKLDKLSLDQALLIAGAYTNFATKNIVLELPKEHCLYTAYTNLDENLKNLVKQILAVKTSMPSAVPFRSGPLTAALAHLHTK